MIAIVSMMAVCGLHAVPVEIRVLDSSGRVIESAEGENFTQLNSAREYQHGDRIVIRGAKHLTVQVDDNVPQSEVFLPQGEMDLEIPFGEGEAADRQCWGMGAFTGKSHIITARITSLQRLGCYRNLALNASADWRMATSFPYATSSHAYLNRSVWSAKAAIDGMTAYHPSFDGKKINNHIYPNQSWGPDQVDRPWIKIDFGREVVVDQMSFFLRDYFKHDNHWSQGEVAFPGGETHSFKLDPKNAGAQSVVFPAKKVSFIEIRNLTHSEKVGWASFSEIQVFGHDAETQTPQQP